MWNFEAKAVLGCVVTVRDNFPQGSGVGQCNFLSNPFTVIIIPKLVSYALPKA